MKFSSGFYLIVMLSCNFSNASSVDFPWIDVLESSHAFVEDRPTTFKCFDKDVTKDTYITWMVVADNAGSMFALDFQLPFQKNSELRKANINGINTFTVSMRRDFSHCLIACILFEKRLSRKIRKTFYRIPEVRETIPIDAVIFQGHDLVLGSVLRFFCDVKAAGHVQHVFVKSDRFYTAAKRSWKLKAKNWTRYEIVSKTRSVAQKGHNGKRWQCVAATGDYRSNAGNVLSSMKELVVHYFEFQEAPLHVTVKGDGKSAVLNFKIVANPKPEEKNLRILTKVANLDYYSERQWMLIRTETSDEIDQKFDVLLGCRFVTSGEFLVEYRDLYVNASRAFSFVTSRRGNIETTITQSKYQREVQLTTTQRPKLSVRNKTRRKPKAKKAHNSGSKKGTRNPLPRLPESTSDIELTIQKNTQKLTNSGYPKRVQATTFRPQEFVAEPQAPPHQMSQLREVVLPVTPSSVDLSRFVHRSTAPVARSTSLVLLASTLLTCLLNQVQWNSFLRLEVMEEVTESSEREAKVEKKKERVSEFGKREARSGGAHHRPLDTSRGLWCAYIVNHIKK